MVRTKIRKKLVELKSDEDLIKEEKYNLHRRREELLDSLNYVIKVSIYVIGVFLLFWLLSVSYIFLSAGNTKAFDDLGKQLLAAIAGYLFAHLQRLGIGKG